MPSLFDDPSSVYFKNHSHNPRTPVWTAPHGMSSLYHNHGDKQYRLQVNTITYKDLLYLTGYNEIELLKIDTEGHDLIILKEALRKGNPIPNRIIVEHKHVDAVEMEEILSHFGYNITKDEENYYGRLGE